MAKRKKQTAQSAQPDIANSKKSELAYTGYVKVGLEKRGKISSLRTFKNNGRWPLFLFLNQCLAGDYQTGDPHRPRFIRLFSAGAEGASIPSINTFAQLKACFKEASCCSIYPTLYTSAPNITYTRPTTDSDDAYGTSVITFKFMIPFSQIRSVDIGPVNAIALYDSDNLNTLEEPAAFIFISDSSSLSSILPEGVTFSENLDYNLYIEWSLSVDNFPAA